MAAINFAYFEIDGQIIHSVKSGDVTIEDPQADVILTLSPRPYALGHKRGVDSVEFSIEVLPMEPAEYDWHAAAKTRRTVTIVYEESADRQSAGARYMLAGAQFYSIAVKHTAEGDSAYTITGKALRHIEEP